MTKIKFSLGLIILSVLFVNKTGAQETGTFTDVRDGKVYKTVKIGTQVWFAENLAFKSETNCWVYEDKESNSAVYGCLYNFESAQNVCPDGWHLPSDEEWELMTESLNAEYGPFQKNKDKDWEEMGDILKSKYGWFNDVNGTDLVGFNALPAGCYKTAGMPYAGIYIFTEWWTSTLKKKNDAWIRGLYFHTAELGRDTKDKSMGYSVRCVQD